MTPTRTFFFSSALALAAASPALADLTADQVLEDQLRQMQAYGLTATVTNQSRSGDTITVEGLSAAAVVPDGDFRLDIGGAMFRELGDGTVEITYPDVIPMTLSGTSADGEEFEMEMSITQSGTRTVASGIPEELRYDFASESVTISDMRFVAPEEAAELDMDVSMQLAGMSGFMELVGGGTVRDYTAQFLFETMSANLSGVPDDADGEFNLAFEGQNLSMDYAGSLAPQEILGSMADSILAGNRTNGTASHGPLTYTVSGDGPDGTFEMAAAIASGTFDFKMDEAGLDYGGSSKDMTVSVGGSFMPLPPLTFKMAETGGRFAMPVVPSEDSQDFALRMVMQGVEVDQMLWGMFDPTGQLPRDPANLIIDLDGAATLTEDIFDPEIAEQMTGAPGELDAVTINQILLNLAGAELTGDGAFTFNNTGPVPMPSGTLNAVLQGGNGLLDTLVNMGLLPQEQAMGARMMMSMFARPGDGPDTLVSTIEVKEDGSVLANGQRIR